MRDLFRDPDAILAGIQWAVDRTTQVYDSKVYRYRLISNLRLRGFPVREKVKVAARGTKDGRAGFLQIVLPGYAAIQIDGYRPRQSSHAKLLQAPAGCQVLAIILRLGYLDPSEWISRFVPNGYTSDNDSEHTLPQGVAFHSAIRVISAPAP